SICLPVCAVAPIAEGLNPAVFVTVEDLVAGLPRNPELGAQRRHLLALEQAGDKPESLVHDVTLLPRHAPSYGGKVSPIRSEYAVTSRSGRTLGNPDNLVQQTARFRPSVRCLKSRRAGQKRSNLNRCPDRRSTVGANR